MLGKLIKYYFYLSVVPSDEWRETTSHTEPMGQWNRMERFLEWPVGGAFVFLRESTHLPQHPCLIHLQSPSLSSLTHLSHCLDEKQSNCTNMKHVKTITYTISHKEMRTRETLYICATKTIKANMFRYIQFWGENGDILHDQWFLWQPSLTTP